MFATTITLNEIEIRAPRVTSKMRLPCLWDGTRVPHSLGWAADKQPEWNKSSIPISFIFARPVSSSPPWRGCCTTNRAPRCMYVGQSTSMYLIESVDSFYAAAASTFIPQNAKDSQFISEQADILRVDARPAISCFYLPHAPQHTRHIPSRTRPSGEELRQFPSQEWPT